MSYKTIDNIIASMPECEIHPLQGPPNLEYLAELNTYLNSCSASVHSNLGCRTLGHIPLTAPPSVYALLSATNCFVPTNPGSTVQLGTEKALAAAVISALTCELAENLRVWKTYTDTDKVYNQKILSLVLEVYYRKLQKNTQHTQE